MKILSIYIAGLFLSAFGLISCVNSSVLQLSDKEMLVQMFLDFPEFQDVISQKTFKNQGVIFLEKRNLTMGDLDNVKKFGKPVKIKAKKQLDRLNSKHYFSLSEFLLIGNNARLQFYYPEKDLTLSLGFEKRNTSWKVINSFIDEG